MSEIEELQEFPLDEVYSETVVEDLPQLSEFEVNRFDLLVIYSKQDKKHMNI